MKKLEMIQQLTSSLSLDFLQTLKVEVLKYFTFLSDYSFEILYFNQI